MTAYGKLTWSFMDKSMFFIIGGVLLLALSWVLNRRKNRFLTKAKEDDGHDD
jgi:LPXTG-motif cell wall-anchored protein